MRTSTLLHKTLSVFSVAKKVFSLGKIFTVVGIIFIFFPNLSVAQWSDNPEVNLDLILDAVNPVEISAIENPNGGTFIFWQDTKQKESQVFFQHIDQNGRVSFRADGKRLSTQSGIHTNPNAAVGSSGAVVVWKIKTADPFPVLVAQKVHSNGMLYWSDMGSEVSDKKSEIINHSIAIDKNGLSYVSYIEKSENAPSVYTVKVQRLSITGYSEFENAGVAVAQCNDGKNLVSVQPDNNGGFRVFWVESINKKNVLMGAGVNSLGKKIWGPNELSKAASNIISYRTLPIKKDQVYLIWQNHNKPRTISHQLINHNGNALWEIGGANITRSRGDNTNPQIALSADSSVLVSWTNDFNRDKNIFVQKFKQNGKEVWEENGSTFSQIKGDQFGQYVVSDGKGGAIVAWFDKRDLKIQPNIYGQRISRNGELLWDQTGTALAVYKNSEKSYLNLVSDQNNGAIALFKGKRESITSLFGQRIFAAKTYTSLIYDFTSSVRGDSVLLSWRSNNVNASGFRVEKYFSNEEDDSSWVEIGNTPLHTLNLTNQYQFSHLPDEAGTHYYRIALVTSSNVITHSDIMRVNFIVDDSENISVYQNTPNPFSDSTVIIYQLAEPRKVKFEIYNSRIEKIGEHFISDNKSGRNRFVFYSGRLPSGVYFYRFTVGEFIEVKKMVITK